MKLNQYIIFSAFLLIGLFSCKEDYVEPVFYGSISGRVLKAEDLTPINDAVVKISPINTTTMTDENGNFVFEELPTGGYTLEVRKSEFGTEILSLEVLQDKTTDLDILLEVDLQPVSPPGNPILVAPVDQALDLGIDQTLVWLPAVADEGQELFYSIYLFKQGSVGQTPIAEELTEPLYEVTDLDYATTYHWQVVVSNNETDPVFGPIWTFTTADFPVHRMRWVRQVDDAFQIFCSDEDNGTMLQISESSTSCWRPKLSPNRMKIAFLSNNGIATHLFIMAPNGDNVEQVTNIPVAGIDVMDLDYCWSPNSAQLLYPSNDKLFSINQDGTGLQTVATAPQGMQFASVDWSELDDQRVVRISGNNVYESEIHLIDADGNWSLVIPDEPGRTGNPIFSVDGTKILYSHDVSGFQNLNGRQLDTHIFLHDLNTGSSSDLSISKTPGTNDLDPSFSPTGSEVIFTNTPNDGVSTKYLYKVGLFGEDRDLLVEDAEMGDWH